MPSRHKPARASALGACRRGCSATGGGVRGQACRCSGDLRGTPLLAAVFVRRRATRVGPLRFGHVAWAFQIGVDGGGPSQSGEPLAGVWSAGAVENAEARPMCAAERAGYWAASTEDLAGLMRLQRYDAYKLVRVTNACPDDALRVQAAIAELPYAILFRNCVTRTKQVLRTFGAALPSTRAHWIPNDWFDQIPAAAHTLAART